MGGVDFVAQPLSRTSCGSLPVGGLTGIQNRATSVDDRAFAVGVDSCANGGRQITGLWTHARQQDRHVRGDLAGGRDIAGIRCPDHQTECAVLVPGLRAACDGQEQWLAVDFKILDLARARVAGLAQDEYATVGIGKERLQ